ncbi:phage portal protein [bacterium AH-315-P15]|nr:phage portal protein [bacterium AH-315-P15]
MIAEFFDGLRRLAAPEKKQSAAAGLVSLHLTGQPYWTPRNYGALAREGYAANPIAFRCVRALADAAASMPLVLYEGDRELTNHPLLDLLTRPNPLQAGQELLATAYSHLQIAGNSYLEVVSVGDDVKELYVLRPDRMKVVPGARGWPEAYEYSVSGRTHRFKVEGETSPILHLKTFNPTDDHYGHSAIEAAAPAIDIYNQGGAWLKALLDNAARPSGALVYRGPVGAPNLTADQFDRLKAELEENYQGAKNAGRPLLLEGGLEWQSLSFSPSDLQFLDARNASAREIALAFGVPPMLLGIPGDNTYSNYREANLAFWRMSVLPLVNRTLESLSGWLGPRFGGELGEPLRLGVDLDGVEALTLEREALWARVEAASFLTRDEKREAVGYGASGEEETDKQPQPLRAVSE